jgi:hypothetical protein
MLCSAWNELAGEYLQNWVELAFSADIFFT